MLGLLTITFAKTNFAQLDSISASVLFTQEIDTTFDITNNDPSDFMNISVWVNDVDFLGQVMISIFDSSSGIPMARFKLSIAELQEQGMLEGNIVRIPIGFMSSEGAYRVEVDVQNFQLAYLPKVTISYP